MWIGTGRILFVLLPAITFASELNLTASVDRTEVGLEERLILTVTVQGENIGQVPSPRLPELPDFEVVGESSSQQTSIQVVNGKMTRQNTLDFTYRLSPREVGEALIAPVTLDYQGKKYETRAIAVNVVEGSTERAPPRDQRSRASGAELPIKDNLKLVATANRKEIYWGEEIVVEFALYTRVTTGEVSLAEPPAFNGFWVKPIYDAKRLDFKRRNLDGTTFDVCVLKRSALFPVSSGELEVGPMELNVAVVQRSRDFFDLFGRTRTVRVSSQPITINVRPLPAEGKPDDFSGAVGQFTIRASLDQTTSEAAEPINLTVRVDGTGSIPFIEKPTIPEVPGVRILDPELRESTQASSGRMKGYKEFRYPVIPQTDGEHLIPAITISYFDPTDEIYRTIQTGELRFTASQTSAATEFSPARGLTILGDDIRHTKPDRTKLKAHSLSTPRWLFLLYIGSLGLVGLSLLVKRHRARLLTDRAYARRLRSNRTARRRLKEAEGLLKQGERQEFYSTLSKTILGYLGDRYNWDVHAMTRDELRQGLMKKGVQEELIDEVMDLLGHCETVCFSPDLVASGEPGETLSQVRKVVSQL